MAKKHVKKVSYFVITFILSAFFAMVFQPLLTVTALDVLVNIYAILAGFLIGIIALIGDPASLPSGSWRIAEASTKNTFRSLKGTRNLLYVYLVTLFCIFLYKLFTVAGILAILEPFDLNIETFLLKAKSVAELFILFCS